jgi:hypothetical protein
MGRMGTYIGPRGVESVRRAPAQEVAPGAPAQAPAAPVSHAQVAVPAREIIVRPSQAVSPRQSRSAPVSGAEVLDLIRDYLAHYVAFPSEAALTAVTAWIGHAVARDRDETGVGQLIWRASPRLMPTSRKRGSGKSTLLDLIVLLTKSRDGKVPKITPRAIAETLGEKYEVAVLDEAKTMFGQGSKSLDLQGILLAGYTPRTSYRVAGKSIPLFGAVAYAGKDELIAMANSSQIGDLLDRSIIIHMRAPRHAMPEVDEDAEEEGDGLGTLLIAWTDWCRDELRQAAKDLAVEDREVDVEGGNFRSPQIWRPLRAICRVAGDHWEEDIDAAAEELTGGGAEMAELLTELRGRAQARASGEDEEIGEIVTEPGGGEEGD